jgi:hypothetical protein
VAPGANLRQSIVPSEDFDFAGNIEKFNKEELYKEVQGEKGVRRAVCRATSARRRVALLRQYWPVVQRRIL